MLVSILDYGLTHNNHFLLTFKVLAAMFDKESFETISPNDYCSDIVAHEYTHLIIIYRSFDSIGWLINKDINLSTFYKSSVFKKVQLDG